MARARAPIRRPEVAVTAGVNDHIETAERNLKAGSKPLEDGTWKHR